MKIYKLEILDKNMKIEQVEVLGTSYPPYFSGIKVEEPYPVQKFKVYRKGRYSDFVDFGSLSIFSLRAVETVKDLLGKNVQLLDIDIIDSDVECKILNVLCIEDAIDFNRSKPRRIGKRTAYF